MKHNFSKNISDIFYINTYTDLKGVYYVNLHLGKNDTILLNNIHEKNVSKYMQIIEHWFFPLLNEVNNFDTCDLYQISNMLKKICSKNEEISNFEFEIKQLFDVKDLVPQRNFNLYCLSGQNLTVKEAFPNHKVHCFSEYKTTIFKKNPHLIDENSTILIRYLFEEFKHRLQEKLNISLLQILNNPYVSFVRIFANDIKTYDVFGEIYA